MIGFRAEYAGGKLKPDGEEVVESGWFDREHLPEIPRHGSIARAMLDAWVEEPQEEMVVYRALGRDIWYNLQERKVMK
jgi:NADH pyrophosphatase NudC (nudix superfamily)